MLVRNLLPVTSGFLSFYITHARKEDKLIMPLVASRVSSQLSRSQRPLAVALTSFPFFDASVSALSTSQAHPAGCSCAVCPNSFALNSTHPCPLGCACPRHNSAAQCGGSSAATRAFSAAAQGTGKEKEGAAEGEKKDGEESSQESAGKGEDENEGQEGASAEELLEKLKKMEADTADEVRGWNVWVIMQAVV